MFKEVADGWRTLSEAEQQVGVISQHALHCTRIEAVNTEI